MDAIPYGVMLHRPRGLMDKASDFGSEDCEFESRRGHKGKFSGHIQVHLGGLVKMYHVRHLNKSQQVVTGHLFATEVV